MKNIEIPTNKIPFVIVNRDRLTDLKVLLNWIYNVNTVPVKVIIIDNCTTYKPLIEYYIQLRKDHPELTIAYTQFNAGTRIIEQFQFVGGLPYYIYTDSDVVPDESCPRDVISKLIDLSNKYPKVHKIGLTLRTDDLPSDFPFRDEVIKIEQPNHSNKTPDGDAYNAEVRSSFAIYKRGFSNFRNITKNLRTVEPLCARHLFWYYTLDSIPPDIFYYITRCTNESYMGKKFLSSLISNNRVEKLSQQIKVLPAKSNVGRPIHTSVPVGQINKSKPISILSRGKLPREEVKLSEPQITKEMAKPIESNIDLQYNRSVIGKSYDYKIQNNQVLYITFNSNFTVTGPDGELGKFYMAENRMIIEWQNCLNNTIDVLDFSTTLSKFTGTSIDNENVIGILKKTV